MPHVLPHQHKLQKKKKKKSKSYDLSSIDFSYHQWNRRDCWWTGSVDRDILALNVLLLPITHIEWGALFPLSFSYQLPYLNNCEPYQINVWLCKSYFLTHSNVKDWLFFYFIFLTKWPAPTQHYSTYLKI